MEASRSLRCFAVVSLSACVLAVAEKAEEAAEAAEVVVNEFSWANPASWRDSGARFPQTQFGFLPRLISIVFPSISSQFKISFISTNECARRSSRAGARGDVCVWRSP